jgi:hypothetical protein
MDMFSKLFKNAKKNVLFFTLVIKKLKPEEGPNPHLKQAWEAANR